MHWCLDEDIPKWDFSWNFIGPVPNYLLGGVYALLKDDDVIYIGLGISKGNSYYKNRGLSRRMMSHVYRTSPKDHSTDVILRERWLELGVNKVATFGFSESRNYLAVSLEDYLIDSINPTANSLKN